MKKSREIILMLKIPGGRKSEGLIFVKKCDTIVKNMVSCGDFFVVGHLREIPGIAIL